MKTAVLVALLASSFSALATSNSLNPARFSGANLIPTSYQSDNINSVEASIKDNMEINRHQLILRQLEALKIQRKLDLEKKLDQAFNQEN